MKIFGMNCQGLGNDPTVRSLLDILKRYDPDVMFLSETHLDDFPAECLRRHVNMDFKICNLTTSRSGGVLLLWKREISIQ
jgi:exonuclease III